MTALTGLLKTWEKRAEALKQDAEKLDRECEWEAKRRCGLVADSILLMVFELEHAIKEDAQ